jgi:hypothetical protein
VRRDVAVIAMIALSGAAGVAACGLTANFDGLQDGGPDAGHDTSTRLDSGVADTSQGQDTGTEPEGGTDAGFCESLTTPVHFCADFDEGAAVDAGWSGTDIYQGSTVSLDDVYFSRPSSMLSQISDNDAQGSARLVENVPTSTPHVHVEFELLLPPASGNFELCTLHQPVGDTTYGVFYKYQDGNLLMYMRTLADDGGEIDVTNQIGAPPAGWLHVEIDCDVSESGTIVIKHDGAIVVNDMDVDTSTLSRASMFVEVGYYSFMPATAQASFDNVIVDWE